MEDGVGLFYLLPKNKLRLIDSRGRNVNFTQLEEDCPRKCHRWFPGPGLEVVHITLLSFLGRGLAM